MKSHSTGIEYSTEDNMGFAGVGAFDCMCIYWYANEIWFGNKEGAD